MLFKLQEKCIRFLCILKVKQQCSQYFKYGVSFFLNNTSWRLLADEIRACSLKRASRNDINTAGSSFVLQEVTHDWLVSSGWSLLINFNPLGSLSRLLIDKREFPVEKSLDVWPDFVCLSPREGLKHTFTPEKTTKHCPFTVSVKCTNKTRAYPVTSYKTTFGHSISYLNEGKDLDILQKHKYSKMWKCASWTQRVQKKLQCKH